VLSFVLAAVVTLVPSSSPPQAGCEAHVVSGGVERVAPCGAEIEGAVEPAVGWVETPSSITPFRVPVSGRGTIGVGTMVPAGLVTFPRDRSLAAGERIRLISLLPPREGNLVRALFHRDVTSALDEPRMPAGPAVALLLDARGRALTASAVFPVRPGMATEVWPARGATTLVAWLARSRHIEREDEDPVALTASGRTPNAFVNASDAVFALWSDVPAGEARIAVESDRVRLAADSVSVARASLTMLEEPLVPLPALTIALAPWPSEETQAPAMTLDVLEAAGHKVVRTVDGKAGQTLTIDRLPAAPLRIRLRIGDFVLFRSVDLTSGADARVDIPLEPLTLSGTVYFGDEAARAIVRIEQRDHPPLTSTTDERGAYALTLWQPQRYVVETVLDDRPEMPPFSQLIRITASTTLDIRVPANALRVRVYDAVTKKPVQGAQVVVHNRWKDESGMDAAGVGSLIVSAELTLLPPQRPGTSEIRVQAAGYRDADPIIVTVDAQTRERVIDVALTASANANELTIRLPDSSPAAGAEVASWSGERMGWRGTADAAGRLPIPSDVAQSRLVIRHPSAASDVVLLGTMATAEALSLPSAAPPLMVKVVRRDGSPPGPSPAKLSLWLAGGVRLSGAEAGFATWSFGATSPDGTTTLRGLRPQPLRLFATRNASAAQVASGTFDGLAVTIPHPWPAMATVPLVDE